MAPAAHAALTLRRSPARHHQGVLPLAPMLLTTATRWPTGGDWALEPKWDGYRFVAHIDGGRARCWTRHATDLTARVGAIASELVELLPDRSVIDGELVALAAGPDGQADQDFDRLSRTIFGAGSDRLWLVIFDAPLLAGVPLAPRPWHERRQALEATLAASGGGADISLIDVFDADPIVHDRLLALGFEGSVLKRRDGRYLPGRRSSSWRKLKTRSASAAVVEVAAIDRASGIVERVGCRTADDPDRLTWAVVWSHELRARLTRDPRRAIGRDVIVTYTHRTIAGALREARLTSIP
jgi:bifunctional non-homologous end joining protein LigD